MRLLLSLQEKDENSTGYPYRIMVAQAMTEPMRLMTVDNKLEAYSELVWKIK